MTLANGILLIFSGLGIAQSLFFSVYLFTYKKGNTLSDRIFSLLLLMLAIRLAKSVVYNFFELDLILMNIGYAAHAAIAPLLLLYVNSFRSLAQFRITSLLHFIPSLIIILASRYFTEDFWLPVGYSILLYHMIVYLVLCWTAFNRQRKLIAGVELWWLQVVTITISVFCLAYFTNFVIRLTPYIMGPLFFSAAIYYLSFVGFRYYSDIFGIAPPVRRTAALPKAEAEAHVRKLLELLTERKLFLDPHLSLNSLARNMDISPHRLSQLINDKFNESFPELINRHRVEDAASRLSNSNEKIATIAFESGFNTLSAFNAAFKRVTSKTPSEFRKEVYRS